MDNHNYGNNINDQHCLSNALCINSFGFHRKRSSVLCLKSHGSGGESKLGFVRPHSLSCGHLWNRKGVTCKLGSRLHRSLSGSLQFDHPMNVCIFGWWRIENYHGPGLVLQRGIKYSSGLLGADTLIRKIRFDTDESFLITIQQIGISKRPGRDYCKDYPGAGCCTGKSLSSGVRSRLEIWLSCSITVWFLASYLTSLRSGSRKHIIWTGLWCFCKIWAYGNIKHMETHYN